MSISFFSVLKSYTELFNDNLKMPKNAFSEKTRLGKRIWKITESILKKEDFLFFLRIKKVQ